MCGPLQEISEPLDGFRVVFRDQREAMRVMRAARTRRAHHLAEREARFQVGQSITKRSGKITQGLGTSGREGQQDCVSIAVDRGGFRRHRVQALKNHVGVRAAEPERAHAGEGGRVGVGPGCQFALNLEPKLLERNMGIRPFKMEARRDRTMLDRERDLDHTGNTGRRLEVADVRLDRAQGARPSGRAVDGKCGAEGLRLDGIAEEGAGSVCLDVLNRARRNAGTAARLQQHGLLGLGVWRGETVGPAILVDRGLLRIEA